MSAKGRGTKTNAHDDYPTKPWVIKQLLEARPFNVAALASMPGAPFLEPCAGAGSIIETFGQFGQDVLRSRYWWAVEIQQRRSEQLTEKRLDYVEHVVCQDYLGWEPPKESFALGITNPPFTLAFDILMKMLNECDQVALHGRLGFLTSKARHMLMKIMPPDVYVHSKRPSYRPDGSTDATDYAWFVWPPMKQRIRPHGKLVVLPYPSAHERDP